MMVFLKYFLYWFLEERGKKNQHIGSIPKVSGLNKPFFKKKSLFFNVAAHLLVMYV